MKQHRDLSILTYPDFERGIPSKPTDWAPSELADWKEQARAMSNLGDDRFERRWETMLEAREDALAISVPYRGRSLPPAEVVHELPLEMLASRECLQSPEVHLFAHRIAELLERMRTLPERGTLASAKLIHAQLSGWDPGRRRRSTGMLRTNNARYVALPGGLIISVMDAEIEVYWTTELLCHAPATPAILPMLRQVASLWYRLIRRLVATSLRLAIPANASLTTPLVLALPLGTPDGYENAFGLLRGGMGLARYTLASRYDAHIDRAERHAFAGELLRKVGVKLEFEKTLQTMLRTQFRGLPVQRLRPASPSMRDVHGRIDDDARRFITAYSGQDKVELYDVADRYVVSRDSITGPGMLGTVHSLALAVDLERSNRVTPTMRLGLCVGG